jgi:hypothetical protein
MHTTPLPTSPTNLSIAIPELTARSTLLATMSALTPLILRLPTELHLDIIDKLRSDAQPDAQLAVMRLRLTNQYFHALIPPATHTTLLSLETTPFAHGNCLYTCKHCLRLRPWTHFADAMMVKKKRQGAMEAKMRFCADCGFGGKVGNMGYKASTEAWVDCVRWVWCTHCRQVKKGDEAGPGKGECRKACKACFVSFGCRCTDPCVKVKVEEPKVQATDMCMGMEEEGGPVQRALETARRRLDSYRNASDTESEGEVEQDRYAEDWYDDDDDWRAFA